MKKTTLLLILINLLFCATFAQTQSNFTNYIFSSDSLNGFDEELAKKAAFNEGFFGSEYKVYMYRAKRTFINTRYNIQDLVTHSEFKNSPFVAATCVNEDFEFSPIGNYILSNAIVGWTINSGVNGGAGYSCSLLGCCPSQPNAVSILSNGYIDPTIGAVYPIYSVFGGTAANTGTNVALNSPFFQMFGSNFVKLNDNVQNFGIHKLSKTVLAGNSNWFRFAFITVLNTGHTCCDGSSFQIILKNATAGTVIASPNYSTSGLSTLCTNTLSITYYDAGTTTLATPSSSLIYSPWKEALIDLSPYQGNNVTVEVIVTDCTAGSHFGCVYFDAQCENYSIIVNGTPYAFGNIPTCGATTASVSAPSGGGSYLWTGPAGFVSTTSQTMVTTFSGTYTLSMSPIGYTAPITHTFSILITPAASVSATSTNSVLCLGNTAILTANGLTNYSWSTGALTSSIVISPIVTTNYTVSGTDVNGCQATNTITQIVSPCTSIETLNTTNGFQIYPNPNNGEFILILENEMINGELIIENTFGQIIYSQALFKGENATRTKELVKGIYYFNILHNKLIVNRGKLVLE